MKKLALIASVVLLALIIFQELRPIPPAKPLTRLPALAPTRAVDLPWPGGGQAALGASGYGLLASSSSSAPVPIASTAKIITALAVLKQKPLSVGSQGPSITFNSGDVDLYNYYYTHAGSVAKVSAGEQISEYQALEAMLLPSANNMADSLANWAFGSVAAYLTYANQMVKSMGLNQTTVGDTNGFSDMTTSTAGDLVKLGIAALNAPVIAQITSQTSAQVPVAGTVLNTNTLLGKSGIVGIKTGNTDKAGGCYLFAARQAIAGQTITLIGAVLGQPDLNAAETAAIPLIKAAGNGFEPVTAVSPGQPLGDYVSEWGGVTAFTLSRQLNLLIWKGTPVSVNSDPQTLQAPRNINDVVGTVTARSGQQTASTNLVLKQSLPAPSFWWRLFHL